MSSSIDFSPSNADALLYGVQFCASDIVYIVDRSGTIQTANSKFWSETGIVAEHAGPAAMLKVIAEDYRQSVLRTWNVVLQSRKAMRSVLFVHNLRGERRVFSVQESPILRDNEAVALIGIGREVTEEYLIDDKIWSSRDDQEANLEYSVRASLGLVKGYVYTLQKSDSMSAEKRDRFCRIIEEEVDTLNRCIDNLLLSRGTGNDRTSAELLNIGELAADVIANYRSEATRRSIELRFAAPAIPMEYFGQSVPLSRIIGNVVDFCMLRVTHSGVVALSLKDSVEYVEVFISDNGPSLSQEQIDWLLSGSREKYTNGVVVADSKFDLDVASLLARSMGGGILARANEDGGLMFTIMLPRASQVFCDDSIVSESISF